MPYWNLSVTVLRGKFNQSYDVCEYISPQKHCDLWWNINKMLYNRWWVYVFVCLCWLWFAAYYCTYSTWQVFVCTNFALSLVTKCDCYVILKLPTACACCHRTKTVNNSNAPKWNETFHFRVHSGVKVKKSVSDGCKETLINKSLTFITKGFATERVCCNLPFLPQILLPRCSWKITVMNDMVLSLTVKSFFTNNKNNYLI